MNDDTRLPADRLLMQAELLFHRGNYELCAMACRAAIEAGLRHHFAPNAKVKYVNVYGAVSFAIRLRDKGTLSRSQFNRLKRAIHPGNKAAHGETVDRREAANILVAARAVAAGRLEIPPLEERILVGTLQQGFLDLFRALWRRAILSLA